MSPTSRDWWLYICFPPAPNPTQEASDYQHVDYRPCYDLTGCTISWAGERGKKDKGVALEEWRYWMHVYMKHVIKERWGPPPPSGKMQSTDLTQFQTKVNGCSIGIFWLYFWPVSSNKENKNSWRNVLGLCSLEEEMMVIVLHFCYSAVKIALYF